MKTWLFNPFIYIAGLKALLIGFMFMTITLVISYYSKTHFDGAIDAHIGLKAPISLYALEQIIAWGSVVLTCFIVASVISKSAIRFIDIAGTMALSRVPMLLVATIGFMPVLHNTKPGQLGNAVLVIGLIMIIPVIWMITLMFNAFKTSANIKGTKAIVGFITALLVAEILSVSLNQMIRPLLLK